MKRRLAKVRKVFGVIIHHHKPVYDRIRIKYPDGSIEEIHFALQEVPGGYVYWFLEPVSEECSIQYHTTEAATFTEQFIYEPREVYEEMGAS